MYVCMYVCVCVYVEVYKKNPTVNVHVLLIS